MTDSSSNAWRYEAKKHDPPESKKAFSELVDDDEDPLTELDLLDDYEAQHFNLILTNPGEDDAHVINGSEMDITINFKDFEIKLPKEMSDAAQLENEVLKAKHIRYCGFPWHKKDGSRNDGSVVLLSSWNTDQERNIRNLYFEAENARMAMMLINAITRLIYESSGKSSVRTHRFYALLEGPVDVAFTTTLDRDARDAMKLRKVTGAKDADDPSQLQSEDAEQKDDNADDDDNLPDLKMTPLYLVIDEESISLFERPFSVVPLHDFRFYREVTPKSIDTIFVCHGDDQLEVQQGEKVFYIQPQFDGASKERSGAAFSELVDVLRRGTVKPKPLETFTGSGKEFESFFSVGYVGKPFKAAAAKPSVSTFEPKFPDKFPLGDSEFASAEDSKLIAPNVPEWLGCIHTGKHLEMVNEDMQVKWFTIEPEIERLGKEGLVPYPGMESAGLDPHSKEHLQNVIVSIKEKLSSEKYSEAVAQYRGCMAVFGETLLTPLQGHKELDVIKRIYFLAD